MKEDERETESEREKERETEEIAKRGKNGEMWSLVGLVVFAVCGAVESQFSFDLVLINNTTCSPCSPVDLDSAFFMACCLANPT